MLNIGYFPFWIPPNSLLIKTPAPKSALFVRQMAVMQELLSLPASKWAKNGAPLMNVCASDKHHIHKHRRFFFEYSDGIKCYGQLVSGLFERS